MPSPLNKWEASLAAGRSMEHAFAAVMLAQTGLVTIKANEEDKRKPDLHLDCPADVKFLQSPYPSNPTPAGLTPETHITLDVANIEKYHPSTILWLVVDYRDAGVATCGLFWVAAGKVQELMRANPKRVYRRSARTSQDKILKVAISTEEVGVLCFPSMTQEETVDTLKDCAA